MKLRARRRLKRILFQGMKLVSTTPQHSTERHEYRGKWIGIEREIPDGYSNDLEGKGEMEGDRSCFKIEMRMRRSEMRRGR
jgi:hypothetical protein